MVVRSKTSMKRSLRKISREKCFKSASARSCAFARYMRPHRGETRTQRRKASRVPQAEATVSICAVELHRRSQTQEWVGVEEPRSQEAGACAQSRSPDPRQHSQLLVS